MTRSFPRALVLIVLLALAVRLVVIVLTPHFTPVTDSAGYDRMSVSIADHGRFPTSDIAPHGGATAFRQPLFPLVLAGAYEIVGTHDQHTRWVAGRVLEAVLGTIAVALAAFLALRLFGAGIGLLVGLIAAIFPPLVLVGSSLMSESLFIPLVLAAVAAALRARSSPRPLRWALLAGALAGLAALTRGNGFVLLPGICLLVYAGRHRERLALRAPLAALAAGIVLLVPWTVRNWEVFGQFAPLGTETGYTIAGTYDPIAQSRTDDPAGWVPPVLELDRALRADPDANEAQLSSRLTSIGLRYVGAHPVSLLRTGLWSTLRLFNLTGTGIERRAAKYEAYPRWLADASVYAFWVVGVLALIGAFTAAARAAPLALWLCPLLLLASTVLVIGLTRYRSPADPFIVMLAALGIAAIAGRLGVGRLGPIGRRGARTAYR